MERQSTGLKKTADKIQNEKVDKKTQFILRCMGDNLFQREISDEYNAELIEKQIASGSEYIIIKQGLITPQGAPELKIVSINRARYSFITIGVIKKTGKIITPSTVDIMSVQ